jgi:hypothetical protein
MRVAKLMIAAAAVLCLASGALAEEQDYEKLMADWMQKYGMPGKEHEYFQSFVGSWTFENTSYMGPEPTVSKGTAEFELVLGGRYLHSTHKGESGGMPFEGMGLSGFDRLTGECFNFWVDSMGTGVVESRGAIDADGKGETLVGSDNYVNTPWGPSTWRMVTDITGPDTFTFTMYMACMGQPESKTMEIKYKRSKAS